MTGSYLGLLGAFIVAVVVPVRDIAQWIVHRPVELALGALGCAAVAAAVIRAGASPGAEAYDQASEDRVRQ